MSATFCKLRPWNQYIHSFTQIYAKTSEKKWQNCHRYLPSLYKETYLEHEPLFKKEFSSSNSCCILNFPKTLTLTLTLNFCFLTIFFLCTSLVPHVWMKCLIGYGVRELKKWHWFLLPLAYIFIFNVCYDLQTI